MVNLKEIYHFSRFQRGSNIFQGQGVQLFPWGGGGSNCLFPIETHITCDFPGGPDPLPPPPPLWILTARPKRFFFILKPANGFTVVTQGFYSLCKFGHAVALITLNLCDLILLLKVKFGQESPVEP